MPHRLAPAIRKGRSLMKSVKDRKKTKNTLIYYSVVCLIAFLRALPRKAAIVFSQAVMKIAYVFSTTRRGRLKEHLKFAYGDEKTDDEIRQLAKAAYSNLAVCIADAIRLPVMVKDGTIDKIVSVENFHRFTDAVKRGKGVILMTGHFGNWELLGTWIVRQGYPIRVVAKKTYDSRMDKLIVDYRNQAGYANTVRGNAKQAVVEGLMNGETFGLLFDLDTRKRVKGVFVDFFGKPAHTVTAPVELATALNVPITPVFIRLTPDYNYVVMCLEELQLVNTGDERADVITNTQICSDVYEQMIRKYPEQWFWMHRRWRSKPDGTGRKKKRKKDQSPEGAH